MDTKKSKLFFNWSSGKDSSFALYELLQQNRFEISTLLTTVGMETERIGMHGLRESLLRRQVEAIGIPLEIIYLSSSASHEAYNKLMGDAMVKMKRRGIYDTAFGDIFLEDLRAYRESQLEKVGIKAHFPLWKRDTKELILEFIELGFKTKIVAASATFFDEDFVGQDVTKDLINSLPKGVDPCGENGEFHTFCYDGPNFKYPVTFELGEKVKKSYPNPGLKGNKIDFWFCDLI
tara:strand:- start:1994 stop:2695 length:702 start_codon:yes stop_codon:yes gene_type:complete